MPRSYSAFPRLHRRRNALATGTTPKMEKSPSHPNKRSQLQHHPEKDMT